MNFKKVITTTGLICLMSACTYVEGKMIRGNGEITNTELSLASFDRIRCSGSADITYHVGQDYKVIITTDSNLAEFVMATVDNNVLNIQTKNGSYSFTELVVNVYCPEISGVILSGSGDFRANETIMTKNFELNIKGSGDVKGNYEVDNFIANINGSGDFDLTGKAMELKLTISGSGDFKGKDFVTNYAEIKINGSGDVDVHVTERLNVQINGSGDVRYSGNPATVNKNIHGSGEVVKK